MSDKTIAQQINIEASKKNIPLSVFIELTHRCNLRCYYCYQKEFKLTRELSLQDWKRIIKELAEMGSLYITLSGGEPLLREDFIGIVSTARYHNFAVSIITNGMLVNESIVRELSDLGIMDVGISLHAASEGLHDKLAHGPGSFQRALYAIRLLVKAGIKVLIKHSVSNANFGEYSKLQKLADAEGCAFECDSTILPIQKGVPSPYALNHEQHFTFLKDMEIGSIVSCMSNKEDPATLHCDAGRSICGIMPNGEVYPCIILPISFGNVSKKSFKDIWYGEKAVAFREQELRLEETCRKCEKNLMCSRCHAVAFLETKKWTGKSESLCERAAAMVELAKSGNT